MDTLERRLVPVEDGILEVFVGGTKQWPVLCGTHSHDAVSDEAGPLAKTAWLVRINPRGFGDSSRVHHPHDASLSQIADDVEAVRRRLGVARWVFHGYSGSGYVGYHYALRYQSALAGLIIGGCPADLSAVFADPRSQFSPAYPTWKPDLATWNPPRDTPGWARVRPGLWAFVEGGRVLFVLSGRSGQDPSERWRTAFAESAFMEVSQRLHEIRVPTLYLHGFHDPAADIDHARATCARLPNAELVIFEQSRHGIQFQEPDKWRATIERFLTQRVVES